MKKILILVIVALALASCAEKTNLTINGTVEGIETGKVYLQRFDNKMYFVVDSANIRSGKFSFALNAEIPEVYGITLDTLRSTYMLFLDGNPTTVFLDSAQVYRNTRVEGSALHDLFLAYRQQQNVRIDEFIGQHPTSLVAAYALYRDFPHRLSQHEIRANIALLDPSLHNTQYVKVLEDLVKTLDAVDIGKVAPDFSLNTPDGVPVKLSDKIGDGYLFLDFWAAWCGPCRREKPNVVAVYNEFKDKGFDILGVSLDHTLENWKDAIESDGLNWTHISDLQFWNSSAATLYGVRSIPANFLIDKNGVIVAKNLRGDNLRITVSSLLE